MGGDNRFKKGRPSKNQERVVGRGRSGPYRVVKPKSKSGWYVHQMVMECWGPPMPDDEQDWVIDHIDEDKDNNALTNLRWLTRADNVRR